MASVNLRVKAQVVCFFLFTGCEEENSAEVQGKLSDGSCTLSFESKSFEVEATAELLENAVDQEDRVYYSAELKRSCKTFFEDHGDQSCEHTYLDDRGFEQKELILRI